MLEALTELTVLLFFGERVITADNGDGSDLRFLLRLVLGVADIIIIPPDSTTVVNSEGGEALSLDLTLNGRRRL